VAVAEELNFTRAAERLFLGQQAVSKSIRQLERELGVVLLERSTHEVRLTAAGAQLMRDGREALRVADAAFEHARLVGHGRAGTIQIGVSPAVGPTERADLVRSLRTDTPELEVSLRDLRPEHAAQMLRNHEVELVLARTAPATGEVHSASLAPTQAHLYVPATHRLAAHPEPATLTDLDGERLLAWNAPGTPLTDLLISRLAAAGSSVDTVLARVWGMAAALADLPDLGAVALLPPNWPHDARVVELSLADELKLPLTILWSAGTPPASLDRVRAAMT
jgi:DNA-binding transcriptional LysR family regulator